VIFIETITAATGYVTLALCLGQLTVAAFLLPQGEPAPLQRSMVAWASASLVAFLLISLAALLLLGSKLQGGIPSGELLWRYLTLTQSGRIWFGRQIYGALLALFLVLLARKNAGGTLLRTATLLVLPLVASRSLSSHASAVREDAVLAVSSDTVHLLATALWGGGLIALWQTLRFAGLRCEEPAFLAAAMVKRFSRLALFSVTFLLLTGLYQTWIHVGSVPTLFSTDYGKALLLKLALFFPMLCIGAVNLFSTKPFLTRLDENTFQVIPQKALRRIRLESLFGIAVFSATGLLTLLPPGVHAVHQAAASATAISQSSQPADGASVKIQSPAPNQIFAGDSVPLKFDFTKGKRGQHVHAYVDGELVGMFEGRQGTLNGIRPGRHALELRVVAADHQTELAAKDRVEFIVK
jgi:putative copper export protein